MLKVFKYDWLNGWNNVKVTLIIAAVVALIAGLGLGMMGGVIMEDGIGITSEEKIEVGVMVVSIVWIAVMMALLVMTVDAIVRNMTTRMFGPEGYITHTLPVSAWELLAGKALGTWVFGVFMVIVSILSVLLMMTGTAVSSGELKELFTNIISALPKLGAEHFRQMMTGFGWFLYCIGAFLAWSLLMVVQFQFICIAARQFGKFHVAGGVIVFVVLNSLESRLNGALSAGFLAYLLVSAACFWGSGQLLKKRLNI